MVLLLHVLFFIILKIKRYRDNCCHSDITASEAHSKFCFESLRLQSKVQLLTTSSSTVQRSSQMDQQAPDEMDSDGELQRLEEENNKAAEAWRKEELVLHRRIDLLYKEKRELMLKQQADSRLLNMLKAKAAEVEEECQAKRQLKLKEEQYAELRLLYLAEVKKEAELRKQIQEAKERKAKQQKLQELKEETSCMEDILKEVKEIGEMLNQKKTEEEEEQKEESFPEQQARRRKWWKRLFKKN